MFTDPTSARRRCARQSAAMVDRLLALDAGDRYMSANFP
jgi:hypothetical protein